jgi:hypothetical protein
MWRNSLYATLLIALNDIRFIGAELADGAFLAVQGKLNTTRENAQPSTPKPQPPIEKQAISLLFFSAVGMLEKRNPDQRFGLAEYRDHSYLWKHL